jgi:hypothetical protein
MFEAGTVRSFQDDVGADVVKIVTNPSVTVDVDRLVAHFGVLESDQVLLHSEIEGVLGMPRISSRYKTVLKKFRRRVGEEQRVYIDGRHAHGDGFIVLKGDACIGWAHAQAKRSVKHINRAKWVASMPAPEELTPEKRNFQAQLFVALDRISQGQKAALMDFSKAVAPQKTLPRVGPLR